MAWFHGESDEVSGTPRILADLREDGEIISRKTVAKTMRKLGLRGICPKRWKTTTVTDSNDTYPADAVNRAWDTGVINAVWIGDITYLRTWEGWLYLATVIDACSRRVIGWAIADHMRTDLVEDALKMAITLRGELPEKVVFHADRGTQYASEQITRFATANGITRSMGRTGVCWDKDLVSYCTSWRGLGGNSVSDGAALRGDESWVAGVWWFVESFVLVVGLVGGEQAGAVPGS